MQPEVGWRKRYDACWGVAANEEYKGALSRIGEELWDLCMSANLDPGDTADRLAVKHMLISPVKGCYGYLAALLRRC